MSYADVLQSLDEATYRKLREALELGKWPDGKPLSREQKEVCMQAVIAWETQHVSPHERSGYLPPKAPCATDHSDEQPLEIRRREH